MCDTLVLQARGSSAEFTVKNKMSELVLYIASKSRNDPNFGMTKLYKILFVIDFISYGVFGTPITDATYMHMEYGPVPNDTNRIRDRLTRERRASIEERQHFGKSQKRIVALVEPDMTVFSEDERRLIDDLIEEFEPFNATQLSEWTHRLIPWRVTTNLEVIPFDAVFTLQSKPVSNAGLAWGERRLKELKDAGLA
jgi:hypothetical protein